MKYLKFHNESILKGRMVPGKHIETSGLCDYFRKDKFFGLLHPTNEDFDQLDRECKNFYCWASDSETERFFIYTPLRQNIVLFMAAMSGEL